jgi:hypothetical protein
MVRFASLRQSAFLGESSMKKRTIAVAVATAAAVFAPAAAHASYISTSKLSFRTSSGGQINDSDRWAGPSTGHAKVCGDVVDSSTHIGNPMVIWRDISLAPDQAVTDSTLWYYAGFSCSSLGATSIHQRYYTSHFRVKETTPHDGYVEAVNG